MVASRGAAPEAGGAPSTSGPSNPPASRARRIRSGIPRHERLDHVPTAHGPDRGHRALHRRHPGRTPPLLFLNGGFGSLQNWDRVIRRLAGKYRAVRFDAQARGRSGTSADYSVRGAVDDISRVIEATGVQRPILVRWSQGATIAVRYAAQHPERVAGLVLIDGAYPITMFDEAGKQKVRTQFRRLGWIMRILAAFGRSARMSPAGAASPRSRMSSTRLPDRRSK